MSGLVGGVPSVDGELTSRNKVWNPVTLSWEVETSTMTIGNTDSDTDGAIIEIDWGHHQIHKSNLFSVNEAVAIGNNSNRDYRITTSTKEAHFVWQIAGDAAVTIYLYEGGNVTVGTASTIANRDRTSSNTATMVVAYGPTVTTTGTLLSYDMATTGSKSGGVSREMDEWILKPSTTYLLRISTGSGVSANVSVKFTWYEI